MITVPGAEVSIWRTNGSCRAADVGRMSVAFWPVEGDRRHFTVAVSLDRLIVRCRRIAASSRTAAERPALAVALEWAVERASEAAAIARACNALLAGPDGPPDPPGDTVTAAGTPARDGER